jgi:mutator protein MutT
VREIQEEIGVTVRVTGKFFDVEHHYPERSVHLYFLDCTILAGEPAPLHVAEMRWVRPEELGEFTFPEADRELISRLRSRR